jgi:hypothetical protein
MFDSAVLEVAIGLALAYVLLSLLCSSINEWIARFRAMRSRTLEGGIRSLLGHDKEGQRLVEELYCHPLIKGFSKPDRFDREFRETQNLPSYIPSRIFALALFDVVSTAPAAGSAATVETAETGETGQPAETEPAVGQTPMDALRAGVERIKDTDVGRALRSLLDDLPPDALSEWSGAVQRVETWFNDGMQRVSGQYKRTSQTIIVAVALVVAVALNVDTLDIIDYLWSNHEAQEALASAANATGQAGANALGEPLTVVTDNIEQGVPIGWSSDSGFNDITFAKIAGLLLTTLAISLGAPFWFDLLNKLVNLRATGTPPPATEEAETTK